ncbi:glycosyltransferase [Halioglobus japonicus]|uniref:glycosyltransferase n=1 Tax=Halioglobus japonicus TaxID=930805 RepID=UPI0011AFB884|nr:glycosyltransferase [Halioglobus japonicus]
MAKHAAAPIRGRLVFVINLPILPLLPSRYKTGITIVIAGHSLCLVMMVRNESAVIERCLDSVKPYIDRWLIADTGSDDDTCERVERALEGIKGELLHLPFTDFAHVRNQLVDASKGLADFVLWLDADETLKVSSTIDQLRVAPAFQLAVEAVGASYLQPRLVRNDAHYVFRGALAETAVGLEEAVWLDSLRICHHCDGVRWRDALRLERDGLYFEQALLEAPTDIGLLFPLADTLYSRGSWVQAMEQYRRAGDYAIESAHQWYAKYQLARAADRADHHLTRVIGAYHTAYEQDSGRVEPLVWMARRLRQEGQLQAAFDLAVAAIDLPETEPCYYFEPSLWSEGRYVEFIRIASALNYHSLAIETVEAQLHKYGQRCAFLDELSQLREDVLDQQAAHPEALPGDTSSAAGVSLHYEPAEIPAATPIGERRKLCIGMATFDDYDGVYFSIQAVRMFHPEVLDEVQFVVLDNNPTSPCAAALKSMEEDVPHYRYIPQPEAVGTVCKDYIVREANAEYVMIMDCHVFLAPGAIRRLIDYLDSRPDCNDLLQGPLVYDDLKSLSTHFKPGWSGGMYGTWDTDPRGESIDAEPFDIEMQGCGLLAFRRDAWRGFNPRFRGFGAEEGYIQEKFRQAGGRSLCVPFLRWLHRFNRPLGVPYVNDWHDRIRNYVIGWTELGLDVSSGHAHFSELLGSAHVDALFAALQEEMEGPLFDFDAIVYLPGEGQDVPALLASLGIDKVVVRPFAGNELDAAGRLQWLSSYLLQLANSPCRHCLVIQDVKQLAEVQLADAQDALCQVADGMPQVVLAGSTEGLENMVVGSAGLSDLAAALAEVAVATRQLTDMPGSMSA